MEGVHAAATMMRRVVISMMVLLWPAAPPVDYSAGVSAVTYGGVEQPNRIGIYLRAVANQKSDPA
jgi:hypothetical protein